MGAKGGTGGVLPRQVAYYSALLWLCRLKPHFARWPRAMDQFYRNAPEDMQKLVAALMVHGYGILGEQLAPYAPMRFTEQHMRELQRAIGRGPSAIAFRRTEDGDVEVVIDPDATALVRQLAA